MMPPKLIKNALKLLYFVDTALQAARHVPRQEEKPKLDSRPFDPSV
jgi:hypothetical protein